jgi:hypothetical protein
MPFFVSTPMSSIRRSNFWIADAVQFTCSAVATIGIKKFTHGSVSHEIQVCNPACMHAWASLFESHIANY